MRNLLLSFFILLLCSLYALGQDEPLAIPNDWYRMPDICWIANDSGNVFISIATAVGENEDSAKESALKQSKKLVRKQLEVEGKVKLGHKVLDEVISITNDEYTCKLCVKIIVPK
jgi:hypothetical protein